MNTPSRVWRRPVPAGARAVARPLSRHRRARAACSHALQRGAYRALNGSVRAPAWLRAGGDGLKPITTDLSSGRGWRLCAAAACLLLLLALVPRGGAQQTREQVPGITEPIEDVTLSLTMIGRIAKIHFEEGDEVRAGDLLLDLDNGLEELDVARRKLMWESKAELNAAIDRVGTLKIDLDATRQLFETTQSVSKEELEKKELEYRLAEAEVERLKVAEQREEIEYRMAQEDVRRRQVYSPIDGVIAKTFLEEGEQSDPDTPLMRVVNRSKCYFVANIDARLVAALEVGQTLPLTIEGGREPVRITGTVHFISPVVDPASGLEEVKVLFDNEQAGIRPGVAGTMQIESFSHGAR